MINNVAIIGAGAIGGYFIWGLHEKLGENLWVIAEGERAQRLKTEGLIINDQKFNLQVRTPEEAKGADLVLVCTKYGGLQAAISDLQVMTEAHTIVMSLLNGVDSEEIIGKAIGEEHLLYSLMKISSERHGNCIVFNAEKTPGLFYGEKDKNMESVRIKRIEALLENTPLHAHVVPDIMTEIWYKYALNISQNQPQAMVGVGFGAYADSEHMAALKDGLRAEVVAVAKAKGIDVSVPLAIEGKGSPTAKRGRYSTLQDLDAKRHTEVEMFAGTMVRLGKELGVPTPYNAFTYHVIKALEEKNDGLFDYE